MLESDACWKLAVFAFPPFLLPAPLPLVGQGSQFTPTLVADGI